MATRKVYAGTLWWTDTEKQLLEAKLAEGAGFVDQWRISQATTTYRGYPREFSAPLQQDNVEWLLAHTEHVHGRTRGHCRLRNAIQRNVLAGGIQLGTRDIFVFTDLDELVQRQDWAKIFDATEKHGYVRLAMRRYYTKLNLQDVRVCSHNWAVSYAVSGAWLAAHRDKTVDDIRDCMPKGARGKAIKIRGQHFCWLYDSDAVVAQKICNHAHPENDSPRCRKHLLRGNSPQGAVTVRVPVDDTYPTAILENLPLWKNYIA